MRKLRAFPRPLFTPIFAVIGLAAVAALIVVPRDGFNFTSTGKLITPRGSSVDIGGFPVNLEPSPDGRFIAITNTGIEQYLTIVDTKTGRIVSRKNFDGDVPGGHGKDGLYFGLSWYETVKGKANLFVAHGAQDRISEFEVSADGELSGPVQVLNNPQIKKFAALPLFTAGLALSSDGNTLFAVNNQTFALTDFKGSLSVIDVLSGKRTAQIPLPGFPLDAVSLTLGPQRDRKVYVSSERDGVVCVVDTQSKDVVKQIRTGDNPTHLRLNRDQSKLYVSNSSSDTISVIDTGSDQVIGTIMVRPPEMRGLPGATPLGMGLSPDGGTLYVALADLNAIGYVDTKTNKLIGMSPTGWYPTAVHCTGSQLLVTVAKGNVTSNPNTPESFDKFNPNSPVSSHGDLEYFDFGPNIRKMLRGLVSALPIYRGENLAKQSQQVVQNNRFKDIPKIAQSLRDYNPGIKHVIYVIKENRSYDQMFGDIPTGNGDPKLLLFGDSVVPNQRALAKRFVLLDNFHVCAEMSADGWSWTTAGIASEFVERNAQYDYSGRPRNYDYEGQSNGSPVDAMGIRNVNDPDGGYLWDAALKAGVEFKNYGVYIAQGVPIRYKKNQPVAEDNSITMKAFEGRTALDYRMFDMSYAESEAWEKHGKTFPKRLMTFGSPPSKSRFEVWNRDYNQLVKSNKVPPLMLVRFGNDHTAGTAPGFPRPATMLADNDYAVGQLVEAVSHGPLWKDTCIVILEDDAQGGFDHVESHRSIGLVISPFTHRGMVDSRFYNTDSGLRTVTQLLGIPPTNHFMASAWPVRCFDKQPLNIEPYDAILPPSDTFKINSLSAYRAQDSQRLFSIYHEESAADLQLADILWGDAKGWKTPKSR